MEREAAQRERDTQHEPWRPLPCPQGRPASGGHPSARGDGGTGGVGALRLSTPIQRETALLRHPRVPAYRCPCVWRLESATLSPGVWNPPRCPPPSKCWKHLRRLQLPHTPSRDSTRTRPPDVRCFIDFPSEPGLTWLTKSAEKLVLIFFLSREISTYAIFMHFHLSAYLCEPVSL